MRKNEAKWIESAKRWQINVQKDGERKTFTCSTKGKKGKIEAEHKADKWLLRGEDENIKAGTLLSQWLDDLKISTSDDHWRQYDQYVRLYIGPAIEKKRIIAVTEIDLQRIIDKAYAERHLAAKTLKNIRSCISSFFKYCRGLRATTLFPESLKIPKSAKRSEKKIAQPDELKILFTTSDTKYKNKIIQDPLIHAYRLAVATGMRPGELLGLKWTDIKNGIATIQRSYSDRGNITQGKNENARRSFQLSQRALLELADQKEMLKTAGIISPYVFADQSGQMYRQKTYRYSWYRYCNYHQITRTTPYELRHTFVSIADDMPDGLKKQTVGHSRSMDTEGVYGHRKKGDLERAAAYVDGAFDRIL